MTIVKTFFIKVQKRNANKLRLYLKQKGLLDVKKDVLTKNDYIFFPIKNQGNDLVREIKNELTIPVDIVYREAKQKRERPRNLEEILRDKIPSQLIMHIPKSFDIIGDICIIELDSVIEKYAKEIAEAILQLHKNVHAVFLRAGDVQGIIRVRPLKFIAGEFKTETIHKENGCIFYLDVTKVYFSPRLGREHWRVAEQIRDNETVVDMFAGVGPYVIPAAKRTKAVLYAIDINPDAHYYLKKNIIANKVGDRVIPILGDVSVVVRERLKHVATRVIMNLPKHAHKYLDTAFLALSSDGGIIHFYSVGREPDIFENALKYIMNCAKSESKRVEILYKGKVKEIAPRKWQVVLDVKVY